MKQTNSIKIAFVDITRIYKEGLRIVLKKACKIDTVGESKNDTSLLKFIATKKPDVLLLDAYLLYANKLKAVSAVIAHYPEIKVVVLSCNADDPAVTVLVEAGVHGIVARNTDEEIIEVIKEVYAGKLWFSKCLKQIIESALFKKVSWCAKSDTPVLTDTEKEIIKGICGEMSNKEIGEKLFLSVRTVEGIRVKLLQKIKAKGTAGIVLFAVKNGLFNAEAHAADR